MKFEMIQDTHKKKTILKVEKLVSKIMESIIILSKQYFDVLLFIYLFIKPSII